MVVNSLTSGALLNKLRLGISSLLGSQSLASDVMIILGMLFFVFCWIFIQTVYIVITRRIFLGGAHLRKVRFLRFLYLIRVRRWAKTAWNMLMLAAFQFFVGSDGCRRCHQALFVFSGPVYSGGKSGYGRAGGDPSVRKE